MERKAGAGARPAMIPLVVAWAAVLKDFKAATVMKEVVIVAAGAVEIVFIIAE